MHNRNVFAVADSDEWDDKAHDAGQFDSTLVSPSYKVRGGKTATLSFASNYRIDGPQSGEVFVSFDGGEPLLVKSYEKNFNGVETIEHRGSEEGQESQGFLPLHRYQQRLLDRGPGEPEEVARSAG